MTAIEPDDQRGGAAPSGPGSEASDAAMSFAVAARAESGRCVLTLTGELDVACVDVLRAAVDAADGQAPTAFVVDLTALEFIDSVGLRELLRLHRRTQASEQSLTLMPGPPHVQRVFEVCGLLDILPFADAPVGAE